MTAIAEPPESATGRQRLLATPTGLTAQEIAELADGDLRDLNLWHAGKAGDDDGRPWWPAAIRRLPLESRLRLAIDPKLDLAWERRERQRVEHSTQYLLLSYGHMQDEEGASPMPFLPWPEQIEVMARMEIALRLIVLKARQLGLTWLALHYAIWLMGYNPRSPRATVLALSKTGTDASKLLRRARRIVSLMPPFLRIREDVETRRSNERFKLEGRGMMASLPGTPDAARSETAALILCDEAAFYRNKYFRPTWTASQPTVGKRGQAFVISTGNGPAEAPGDGQAFAELWQMARSGESEMDAIFLPDSTDPERTPAWRASERKHYLTAEDFEAEHPETEEQALAGVSGIKVFSPAGINAAESLGRELDRLHGQGRLAEPAGGLLALTWDWGELTHGLTIWPLEQGGIYVIAEHAPPAGPGVEPGHSTRMILEKTRELQRMREPIGLRDPWPLIGPPTFDSAGVQSMKTFLATAEADPYLVRQFIVRRMRGVPKIPTIGVSFADWKDIGKDYLKYLFTRIGEGAATGVIAISPRCPVLLRQLRGLEVMDDGSGRIKKGDDHGPDALIAHAVPLALVFLDRQALEEQHLS